MARPDTQAGENEKTHASMSSFVADDPSDPGSDSARLTHAGLAQRRRSELAFRGLIAELVRLALLVLHAQSQVAAGLQVIQRFQGVPGYLAVVVVLRMGFANTPQIAATVVMIDRNGLPGVFIDVEVTLGIDVALARLQGRFHVPDAVQLIAAQILIDMAGFDDVRILQVRR